MSTSTLGSNSASDYGVRQLLTGLENVVKLGRDTHRLAACSLPA